MLGRKLPFGIEDIKQEKERLNCCPIIGCKTPVDTKANFCRQHGIYVRKTTYIYKEITDNLIVDKEIFREKLAEKENEKFDIKRIGYENSEDALTWNVFRTFQKNRSLRYIANLLTGETFSQEPLLYLWGLSCSDDSFKLLPELTNFRNEFEKSIKPPTEPDIILYTDKAIISIEAKFTSENKKDNASVFRAYLERYSYKNVSELLNIDYILEKKDKKFYSQLVRNIIFGYYASKGKRFYLISLVSDNLAINRGASEIEEKFKPYLKNDSIFRKVSWEQIYRLSEKLEDNRDFSLFKEYINNKSSNFSKAFLL